MKHTPWSLLVAAMRGGLNDAARMPFLLAFLWLINAASAALGLAFFWGILTDYVGQSGLHESAFTTLRVSDVLEFFLAREEQLLMALAPFVAAGALYVLVKAYLTGGILERLKYGARCSWRQFWCACSREFWKLIVLTILTGALAVVVFGSLGSVFGLMHTAFFASVNHPAPLFWMKIAFGVAGFLLFSVVARIYDYARIALVLNPQQTLVQALWRGLKFPVRYSLPTFVVWCGFLAVSAALAAGYAWLTAHALPETMAAAGLYFLLGQLVVFGRIGCRLAMLGAQMRFMRAAF